MGQNSVPKHILASLKNEKSKEIKFCNVTYQK